MEINLNPSKYFNFDGHGSLTLTDTFEHLQTIGEVKVATMTNEQLNDLVDKDLVEIQDRVGNRISDKFTFTVEAFNKLAVTIKASVKAEFADEFDDLGGVNQEIYKPLSYISVKQLFEVRQDMKKFTT